jgi:hypothetical protein
VCIWQNTHTNTPKYAWRRKTSTTSGKEKEENRIVKSTYSFRKMFAYVKLCLWKFMYVKFHKEKWAERRPVLG